MWPWSSHLISLTFPFFKYNVKMGVLVTGIPGNIYELCLAQWLAHRRELMCLGMSRQETGGVTEGKLHCAGAGSLSFK